jgi:hypothetical protein
LILIDSTAFESLDSTRLNGSTAVSFKSRSIEQMACPFDKATCTALQPVPSRLPDSRGSSRLQNYVDFEQFNRIQIAEFHCIQIAIFNAFKRPNAVGFKSRSIDQMAYPF